MCLTSPALACEFFTTSATWEAQCSLYFLPVYLPLFSVFSFWDYLECMRHCFNNTLDNTIHFIASLLCSLLPSRNPPNCDCFPDACLSAADAVRDDHMRPDSLHGKPTIARLQGDLQHHLTISSALSGWVHPLTHPNDSATSLLFSSNHSPRLSNSANHLLIKRWELYKKHKEKQEGLASFPWYQTSTHLQVQASRFLSGKIKELSLFLAQSKFSAWDSVLSCMI